MFPKVPQSSLGILRVPQLPPPLGHPPLKNPIIQTWRIHGKWYIFNLHENHKIKQPFMSHDGSMGPVYLPTFAIRNQLNPMGVGKYAFRPMEICHGIQTSIFAGRWHQNLGDPMYFWGSFFQLSSRHLQPWHWVTLHMEINRVVNLMISPWQIHKNHQITFHSEIFDDFCGVMVAPPWN